MCTGRRPWLQPGRCRTLVATRPRREYRGTFRSVRPTISFMSFVKLQRIAAVAAGAALAVGLLAGPAWAHVQVTATPGSPGATNATLRITAAGESGTAGTSRLDVVADPAIPADQVTLASGPAGWTLTPGSASDG